MMTIEANFHSVIMMKTIQKREPNIIVDRIAEPK